jgi:hypothetical protein
VQNAIDYVTEGKAWTVFNLLCYLYPNAIKPSNMLSFKINSTSPEYILMVQNIEKMLFGNEIVNNETANAKIITPLWDHQNESVNKIVNGFKMGQYGYGDASYVGSGKTLTSLAIASKLINTEEKTHQGILVLLPKNGLIKTWKTEITDHTTGFNVYYQSANGALAKKNAQPVIIGRNTLIVTTMGRMRDHPINHRWLLVIIDECLTVQNKEALWTEQAWKQCMMAKHMVMMSATFFRARFDKLYYMLKMLRTGLPEKRDYLNTILLESIIAHVPNKTRKWLSTIHRFPMLEEILKRYQLIETKEYNIETKFAKLSSLLLTASRKTNQVVTPLADLIKMCENRNSRCLIYANCQEEADYWSTSLQIPIYPDKGTHCIVTVSNGTYGLNDLTDYDTIVLRPPAPDILPQIKGRLDRPKQEKDTLFVEYFVMENSIEEGLILRMNIASAFMENYIMPLAKFYKISLDHGKYIE